jgi:hypothetical protein
MVQVDVFWSYAIGASLAVAASEQIARKARATAEANKSDDPLACGYFTRTLLFIACLFAPSGIFLLWAFPSWETMHVGSKDMSALLVTGFAVTNVTQGVLGYFLARRAILAGKRYRAFMHFIGGYFGMFFILVHGWDGTGYQRFFSATRAQFEAWSGPGQVLTFLGSDVAFGLYGLGVFFLPPLLFLKGSWLADGHRLVSGRIRSRAGLAAQALVAVFALGLGTAILSSVLIHLLGTWIGIPAAAVFLWLFFTLPQAPAKKLFKSIVP